MEKERKKGIQRKRDGIKEIKKKEKRNNTCKKRKQSYIGNLY